MTNYTELALRTESKPTLEMRERLLANIRLEHAVLGIVTEAIELQDCMDDINLAEECGDLEWYLALIRDAVGLAAVDEEDEDEMDHYDNINDNIKRIVGLAGEMADVIKGFIFYSDPKRFWKLQGHVSEMETCLLVIYGLCKTTRAAVREKNIAKLAKRYGDKFSDFLAVNRDLDAERQILECDKATVSDRSKRRSSSYSRTCKLCPTAIHDTNTTGICTSCYVKAGRFHDPLIEHESKQP